MPASAKAVHSVITTNNASMKMVIQQDQNGSDTVPGLSFHDDIKIIDRRHPVFPAHHDCVFQSNRPADFGIRKATGYSTVRPSITTSATHIRL